MQTIKNLPDMGPESEMIQGGFCIDTVEHSKSGFIIMEKRCTKCKILKSINEFYKDKNGKYGIHSICKQCTLKYKKQYFQKNFKKIKNQHKKRFENNPEKLKEFQKRKRKYNRQYQKINRERINKLNKIWRENNLDKARESFRKHYKNNAEKICKQTYKYQKKRLKNDPIFRLNHNIRNAINYSLKGNKNGHHWESIVGYTLNDLRKYLELTMPKGYTWNDYLKGKLHIDHIRPVSLFNITGIKSKGFKKCWSFENLRLLPASENLKKHNKIFI